MQPIDSNEADQLAADRVLPGSLDVPCRSSCWTGGLMGLWGNTTDTRHPQPGAVSTVISPAAARTRSATLHRPNPSDRGSNKLSCHSNPPPRSSTTTHNSCGVCVTLTTADCTPECLTTLRSSSLMSLNTSTRSSRL